MCPKTASRQIHSWLEDTSPFDGLRVEDVVHGENLKPSEANFFANSGNTNHHLTDRFDLQLTRPQTQGQEVGSELYSNRFASRACVFCERAKAVRILIYTKLGHLVQTAVVICQLNSCYSMLKKRFL